MWLRRIAILARRTALFAALEFRDPFLEIADLDRQIAYVFENACIVHPDAILPLG